MDTRLLELLVCPLCKGTLAWHREARELVCQTDRLAFPVRDGIPVMLEGEARPIDDTVPAGIAPAAADKGGIPDAGR